MAWNKDDVESIIQRFGPVATLWLKALIKKNVGRGKAHNYTVFPGKIKSIAKKYDMDLPGDDEISTAFDDLKRKQLRTPDGRTGTVLLDGKPEYVKLTDHGLTLVTLIDSKPEIEQKVDEFLGGEPQEVEDWFPAKAPDDAPIQMKAVSEKPAEGEESYEVDAIAEFECLYPDCDGEIENTYSFIHPNETWTEKISAECPVCGEVWVYVAGNAFRDPNKQDV
ncbi:hypothetical protein [Haladaptatus sp. DYF46]|uniref:hypothetical protein n=1 Tax=Haladaptatus sp. DYF46 TaxID=2886041 RepID=UPI001E4283B6|nr:hypothetical protein [Haladaptatus sp. DYF46]